MTAQFKFLSGARAGQVESFRKAYIALGRHPLSDVRFDAARDLDVSARHAEIVRHGDRFVVRDLGSTNGTFVNGARVTGDVVLADGDVIGFGQRGPSVEFHLVPGRDDPVAVSTAAGKSAGRMASPPEQYAAVAAPHRSSMALRIATEIAHLRRTTKSLIVLLVAVLAAFGWVEWQESRDASEAARLRVHFQSELASVRDALQQSRAEVARLSRELATVDAKGDARAVVRLRAALNAAQARQRGLAGAAAMDYRAISLNNQDAVALLVVQLSDSEIFSGTAFATDSDGTLVTNRHLLIGAEGNRHPLRIAVKFSGSRQWFPGQLVGVADSGAGDIGVVKVSIRGGTPRVVGFASDTPALARGDPVAIIGYPLGEDLPMERLGESDVVADPTLTVGTVSKTLATLVQVDGYGAPGSSGSPIFDRSGRVAAVLFGGNRESNGKIIYAVPAGLVTAYLSRLGLRSRSVSGERSNRKNSVHRSPLTARALDHPSRRRPLHQLLAMPAHEDRRGAGDLCGQPRMAEQHHQLHSRVRQQTSQRRAGARAQIRPSLPGPGLGVHQHNALHVACCTLDDRYTRLAERVLEHVTRRDGVRPAHVVIDDRDCQGPGDARRIAADQMSGAVGEAVGERRMVHEIGLPLIGEITPRGEGPCVPGERVVGPRSRYVGTDRGIERLHDALKVIRVEQRVTSGRHRAHCGGRHRLRGAGPRHDQRVGYDQPGEVESASQIPQDNLREAGRAARRIPLRIGDERAHHTSDAGAHRMPERCPVHLL